MLASAVSQLVQRVSHLENNKEDKNSDDEEFKGERDVEISKINRIPGAYKLGGKQTIQHKGKYRMMPIKREALVVQRGEFTCTHAGLWG
jgi:hypothetical protein